MLRCPTCAGSLLGRIQTAIGVLWKCDRCDGRAVNLSMLRKHICRDYMNELWQDARKAPTSRIALRKQCPACRRPMTEVATSGAGGILPVDVCTSCHFLWFDRDEAALLPPSQGPEKREEARGMPVMAREVLGMHRTLPIARTSSVENDAHWDASSRFPWAAWTTALLMLAASLFALFNGLDEWIAASGFDPSGAGRGFAAPWAFFVQPGIPELALVLYALLVFAPNVEGAAGHVGLLLMLVCGTVFGAVAHMVFGGAGTGPFVGAAGGLSALVAYHALAFPHVRIAHGLPGWQSGWLRYPSAVAWPVWAGLVLLLASRDSTAVGWHATLLHFTGALAGAAFWSAGKFSGRKEAGSGFSR